jgi:effector-binding domain-containing protein
MLEFYGAAETPDRRNRRRTVMSRLAPIVTALAFALAAGPASAQSPAPDKPSANQPPPAARPSAPSPLQPGDVFGEQVMLPERTIVYMKGHTNWDNAFDTLVDVFKSLQEYLDKQNIKSSGPAITIYTQTDDTGFSYQAGLPIVQTPKDAPKGDIAVGPMPSGKALKFVHRGSYDAMDSTYEAITNYLDDKQLEAKDLFIEEYTTDPVKTASDKLVINVFVPVK